MYIISIGIMEGILGVVVEQIFKKLVENIGKYWDDWMLLFNEISLAFHKIQKREGLQA